MILSLSFGSCRNLIDTSGITKNHLCSEQLHRITELAFGKENTLEAFREMQGGYCNAVYQLEMKDRLQRVILKVAPSADVRLMSCETEMMRTEIFIKDGRISGIIDWERALWAEGLMEDRFRFHSVTDGFSKGYGMEELTPVQKIRCFWYDVYLYLIMMFEVTYRHYETKDQYYWVHGLFEKVWKNLLDGCAHQTQ